VVVLVYGDSTSCKASAVITMFAMVMSATFLTLVGVNLVMVFVFDVKYSPSQLECAYYLCALVYGLITISVPIYKESIAGFDYDTNYRCYYYVNYYQLNGQGTLLWVS
jgi:hypothetical protein